METPDTTQVAPDIAPERLALLTRLAQQAAGWWRTTLEGPGGTIGPSHYDNGDKSSSGDRASIMMSMITLKQPNPAAETFARFEELLAADILAHLLLDPTPTRTIRPQEEAEVTPEQLERWKASPVRDLFVGTDYGPDGRLAKAAQAAGISFERFPWKTRMWVNWDERPANCYVAVRKGYGAQEVRLPAVGEEVSQA